MRKSTAAIAAAIAGLAAAAVMFAGAGPAAAGARPASPAASGTWHFQIMTTSAASTRASVVASGLVTAGGVDVQGKSTDIFRFAGGTVKVRHSPPAGPRTFNPRTCLFTVRQHGTYKVLGGTGKYAGISGHGKYQLNILGIGAKAHGSCSKSLPPAAFQLVVDAAGPASLP